MTFGPAARVTREASGLEVVVLPARAHLRGHPAHPVGAGLARALRGADVVHAHHTRSAPARLAALVARARGQRVVATDHGLGGGGWGGLLPTLFHRHLVVSRHSAATLGLPPHRTRVILGGVDPERFSPGEDGERSGVLFVGRLTPHKGVDLLLRALPAGARAVVAGSAGHDARWPESDYPLMLRRLARGRDVRFAGPVRDDELPSLHRRAAVFALPSVHETCYGRSVGISELLGLSVLEAMASATPVVCSAIGGLPEVVRDGETGVLVEPGDVDALREAIDALLRDPARARRMGRAGRALVLERFTWDACARRCLAAYGELVTRPR